MCFDIKGAESFRVPRQAEDEDQGTASNVLGTLRSYYDQSLNTASSYYDSIRDFKLEEKAKWVKIYFSFTVNLTFLFTALNQQHFLFLSETCMKRPHKLSALMQASSMINSITWSTLTATKHNRPYMFHAYLSHWISLPTHNLKLLLREERVQYKSWTFIFKILKAKSFLLVSWITFWIYILLKRLLYHFRGNLLNIYYLLWKKNDLSSQLSTDTKEGNRLFLMSL